MSCLHDAPSHTCVLAMVSGDPMAHPSRTACDRHGRTRDTGWPLLLASALVNQFQDYKKGSMFKKEKSSHLETVGIFFLPGALVTPSLCVLF